jgi:hypothetical protein
MPINELPYWASALLTVVAMSGIGWSIGLLNHWNKVKAKAIRERASKTHYSYTSAYRSRQ